MFKEKKLSSGCVIYSDLVPELEHFFTTRETVIRSSEEGVDVEGNIRAVCEHLGITRENLIAPVQTHSANIDKVIVGRTEYPDTDALILDNYEQAIYLNFADCTPVILFDRDNNVAAVAHAGWRGTVQRIVPKTVERLVYEFGTKVSNICAVIGPAIGKCCYKVGDEVIRGVTESVEDSSGLITSDGCVDLKMTNWRQLIEIGVQADRIDVCPYCTSCANNKFFSYRMEKGTTSRHSAVVKLKRK